VKEADRLIGRSAGFDYYLTKPYTPEALLGLVAKNRRR
jgi:DNA-binding response OmpR family regulator